MENLSFNVCLLDSVGKKFSLMKQYLGCLGGGGRGGAEQNAT